MMQRARAQPANALPVLIERHASNMLALTLAALSWQMVMPRSMTK
jgi:hypothetical protein